MAKRICVTMSDAVIEIQSNRRWLTKPPRQRCKLRENARNKLGRLNIVGGILCFEIPHCDTFGMAESVDRGKQSSQHSNVSHRSQITKFALTQI